MAHFFVFMAYLTNNSGGKRRDVHDRTYRSVYKKFGHSAMVSEYRTDNSWNI
jgi:hypothetical protein